MHNGYPAPANTTVESGFPWALAPRKWVPSGTAQVGEGRAGLVNFGFLGQLPLTFKSDSLSQTVNF